MNIIDTWIDSINEICSRCRSKERKADDDKPGRIHR